MSRNHSSQSYKVQDLIKRLNATDPDDLERDFGIQVDEEGVWDPVYGKGFDTLEQWAQFNVEMEAIEEANDRYGYGDLED